MQRIAKLEPEYITPPSSYLTFPSPPIILSHFFITSSQAACRFSSHSYVRSIHLRRGPSHDATTRNAPIDHAPSRDGMISDGHSGQDCRPSTYDPVGSDLYPTIDIVKRFVEVGRDALHWVDRVVDCVDVHAGSERDNVAKLQCESQVRLGKAGRGGNGSWRWTDLEPYPRRHN
jgi:hypothetical protein